MKSGKAARVKWLSWDEEEEHVGCTSNQVQLHSAREALDWECSVGKKAEMSTHMSTLVTHWKFVKC